MWVLPLIEFDDFLVNNFADLEEIIPQEFIIAYLQCGIYAIGE